MEKVDRLKIAEEAVQLGMKILNASECAIDVMNKGVGDIVTNFDLEIEEAIKDFIARHDSDVPIQGEERGGSVGDLGIFWVIDPIDGTVNFSKNLPHFAISVAYVENGQPAAAAIGFPSTQVIFSAATGEGAFENGVRLRVSEVSRLSDSVIGFGDFSHGVDRDNVNRVRLSIFSSLVKYSLRMRMHGSAAYDLCMVAKGSLDASVTLSNTAWDVSAGVLIVRESGGVVQDGDGTKHTILSKYTIASNSRISDAVINCIHEDVGM